MILKQCYSERDYQLRIREINEELKPLAFESSVIVTIKPETINSKTSAALHLWFRQCETQLNKDGIKFHGGLSGKLTSWTEGDFKAGVYKKFLRHYKGKESTQKQTNKDVTECLLALTSHIAQEHGSTMPMFPSVENMSLAALLKV